jgi:hypothetical protein
VPRVVRTVENVIQLNAGQLPAAGGPWWYSGRGNDAPTPDGGGVGGTPTAGEGIAVAGLHADIHALHLVIDAWDVNAVGVEVTVEINRAPDGALDWAPVDHLTADPDGIHVDVRSFRAQVLKTDFPNAGHAATIHVPVIAQRLRWGVRAIGAAAGTALYAAHEAIRRVD